MTYRMEEEIEYIVTLYGDGEAIETSRYNTTEEEARKEAKNLESYIEDYKEDYERFGIAIVKITRTTHHLDSDTPWDSDCEKEEEEEEIDSWECE